MTNKIVFKIIALILFFVNNVVLYTQNQIDTLKFNPQENQTKRPMYIGFGFGSNYSSYRDLATSPLFYEGSILQFSFSLLKKDEKKESEFYLLFDNGTHVAQTQNESYSSSVNRVELSYSKLYYISLLKNKKFNTKVGYMLNNTTSIRNNINLYNNGFGYEVFFNIMASAKIAKDISRSHKESRKFLFFKGKPNYQKRELAFRLNIGLINNNYRNGYIYYPFFGATVNEVSLFDGYKFNVFDGFRMSTRIDYTWYQKNRNALQFSYLWDAYKTGSTYDVYSMSHHILRFTLYFNTNNQ